MGLMDILNGMQNGPRGGASRAEGGGMSPVTMALLGLLAYKAVKSFGGSSYDSANPAAGRAAGVPAPGPGGPGNMGGLGDLLSRLGGGGLGAAGAGGLGGLLTGGLGDLLEQFKGAGREDTVKSWVGTGQNEPIAPDELARVLTPEQLDFLTGRTGLSREELLLGTG